MKTSIVIAVYNRADFIEKCLAAVLKQTVKNYEIIIVDDGSTDDTLKIVKQFKDPKIKIVCNKQNSGLAFTRNRGIEESRGELIAFTDSDCIVEPNWLEELIKPFKIDEKIMIVGGRVIDPKPKNYWEQVNKGCNFIANKSGYVKNIMGCNMAYRNIFFNIVKFDEGLKFGGDETDLCLSCLSLDYKIYYSDSAKVTHYHRSSFRATFSQQYHYGYGNACIYLKHHQSAFHRPNAAWLALILVIVCISQYTYFMKYPFISFSSIFMALLFIFLTRKNKQNNALLENCINFPGYLICNLAYILGKLAYLFKKTPSNKVKKSSN